MGIKLQCGCIPDASGFGYCGECSRKLREKIWGNMSEGKKQYDRQFAPKESKVLDDAIGRINDGECCSCHISAPCSFCEQAQGESDEH